MSETPDSSTVPDQDAEPPGNGIDDSPGPHPDPPVDDDGDVIEGA